MPKQKVKEHDLLTIRQYQIHGITVHMEIDRSMGKASFVEPKPGGGWKHKNWNFTGREVGYMRSWMRIFDAMSKATALAIDDLVEYQDAREKEKVEQIARLNKAVADGLRDGSL